MEDIVNGASLDTAGLKTAVCDVNNIKKACYTIQVIAVVLAKKLINAFGVLSSGYVDVESWIAAQQVLPMFNYSYNVLQNINAVLMLIRSFREADFDILIVSLELILPIFLSLDHVNYSRCVSVFLQVFKHLPTQMPSLYKEFKDGHFVV